MHRAGVSVFPFRKLPRNAEVSAELGRSSFAGPTLDNLERSLAWVGRISWALAK